VICLIPIELVCTVKVRRLGPEAPSTEPTFALGEDPVLRCGGGGLVRAPGSVPTRGGVSDSGGVTWIPGGVTLDSGHFDQNLV